MPRGQSSAEFWTREGVVMGTVPYMSPEQVGGCALGHRSDIYSFGVLLYELATGLRPFRSASTAGLMSAILRDTPTPRRLDEAAAYARRARALEPDHAGGLFLRGIVAGLRGQTLDALRDIWRGHRLRPADPNITVERCRFGQASGIEVGEHVDELVPVDPLTPVTWSVVNFNYFLSGRLDEAVEPARRSIELAPVVSAFHNCAAVPSPLRAVALP